MLRSFGNFAIRRTRMYRGQKPLSAGASGGSKQKDSETSRETVQKLIKNDPALARRLRKLRSKTANQQKENDTSEKAMKRTKVVKIKKKKSRRRPNKKWLAFNKKRQPKLKSVTKT